MIILNFYSIIAGAISSKKFEAPSVSDVQFVQRYSFQHLLRRRSERPYSGRILKDIAARWPEMDDTTESDRRAKRFSKLSIDVTRAVELYRKAVDLNNSDGNSDGMLRLGRCYDYGTEVEKDVTRVVEWYRKATDLSNSDGKLRLGCCNEYGTADELDKIRRLFSQLSCALRQPTNYHFDGNDASISIRKHRFGKLKRRKLWISISENRATSAKSTSANHTVWCQYLENVAQKEIGLLTASMCYTSGTHTDMGGIPSLSLTQEAGECRISSLPRTPNPWERMQKVHIVITKKKQMCKGLWVHKHRRNYNNCLPTYAEILRGTREVLEEQLKCEELLRAYLSAQKKFALNIWSELGKNHVGAVNAATDDCYSTIATSIAHLERRLQLLESRKVVFSTYLRSAREQILRGQGK